jgi:hypothetical protein
VRFAKSVKTVLKCQLSLYERCPYTTILRCQMLISHNSIVDNKRVAW